MRWTLGRIVAGLALAVCGLAGGPVDEWDGRLREAEARSREAALRQPADAAALRSARAELQQLVRSIETDPDHGPDSDLWRQARLALADAWWNQGPGANWGAAWSHYQAVLESWAGDTRREEARAAYLGLLRRLSGPPGIGVDGSRPGPPLPVEVLQQALNLSTSREDRARFQFLLALAWRDRARTPAEIIRTAAALEQAIAAAEGTPWTAPALYAAARWQLTAGQVDPHDDGTLRFEPHAAAAAGLLDLLLQQKNLDPALAAAAAGLRAPLVAPRLTLRLPDQIEPGAPAGLVVECANLAAVRIRARAIVPTPAIFTPGGLAEAVVDPAQQPVERILTVPAEPRHAVWELPAPDWPALAPGAWRIEAEAITPETEAAPVPTGIAAEPVAAAAPEPEPATSPAGAKESARPSGSETAAALPSPEPAEPAATLADKPAIAESTPADPSGTAATGTAGTGEPATAPAEAATAEPASATAPGADEPSPSATETTAPAESAVSGTPAVPAAAAAATAAPAVARTVHLLLVTDLQVRVVDTPDRLLAWVTRSGPAALPVGDATVRVIDAEGRRREARTAADGLASLSRNDVPTGPWQVMVEAGGRLALATVQPRPPVAGSQAPKVVLPGQGQARPGETVRWWVASTTSPPPWRLQNGDGAALLTGRFREAAPGWWEAEMALPTNILPGLLAWCIGTDPVPAAWLAVDPPGTARPPWTVTVREEATDDPLAPRRWRVEATHGNLPTDFAAEDPVRITIRRAPAGPALPPLVHELAAAPSPIEADWIWAGSADWEGREKATATLELPPVATRETWLAEAAWPLGRGRAWVARVPFEVGPTGHEITLTADAPLVPAGTPVTLRIHARDRDGRPVAVRGRLEHTATTWTERWTDRDGRLALGAPPAAERRPWWAIGGRTDASWHAIEPRVNTAPPLTVEVVTDRDGNAVWTEPAAAPGRHVWTWQSHDRGGAPVRATVTVWVGPAEPGEVAFRAPPQVVVGTSEDRWAALLLGTQVRSSWLVTLTDANRTHFSQVVRSELGSHLFHLPPAGPDSRLEVWDPSPAVPAAHWSPPLGTVRLLTGQIVPEADGDGAPWRLRLQRPADAGAREARVAWTLYPHGEGRSFGTGAAGPEPWPGTLDVWESQPLPLTPGHWSLQAWRIETDGRVSHLSHTFNVAAPRRASWRLPAWARPGDRIPVTLELPPGATVPSTADWPLILRPQPPERGTQPILTVLPTAGPNGLTWLLTLPLDPLPPAAWQFALPDTSVAGASGSFVIPPPPSLAVRPLGSAPGGTAAGRARDGEVWTIFPPDDALAGRWRIRLDRHTDDVGLAAADAMARAPASDPVHLAIQAVIPERLFGRTAPAVTTGRREPAQARTMLRAIQTPSGAWAAWQIGPPDLMATSAVVFFLRQSGDPRLAELRDSGRQFLVGQLAAGTLHPIQAAWVLAAVTAPAPEETATGRAPEPALVNTFLELMGVLEGLPPDARGALSLAALGLGFEEDARRILEQLPRPGWYEEPEDSGRWLRPRAAPPVGWPATATPGVEPALANATLLLAATLAGGPEAVAEQARESLLARRKGATWGSPVSTGMALLALAHACEPAPPPGTPSTPGGPGEAATGRWRLEGGEQVVEWDFSDPSTPAARELPWPDPASPLNLTWRGPGTTGTPLFSLEAEWDVPAALQQPRRDGTTLRRWLVREYAESTLLRGPRQRREPVGDPVRVRPGDVLEVTYTFEVTEPHATLVLTEHLPAGFHPGTAPADRAPVASELRPAVTMAANDDPERYTGRQRVAQFAPSLGELCWVFEDLPVGSWEFQSRWVAEHAGTYRLPPAELAPLTDRHRPARSTGGVVTVAP